MSRTRNMIRNMKWSYIGTVSTMGLGFIVRAVFFRSLGKTFLGLNSLYASIIGVLSIAELGIGGILNTQLYKPIAEKDEKTIIAILQLYKKIYRIIAFVILAIGLLLIPFLNCFLKGAENLEHVKLYYLFFLFNTVMTYFVSYKFSISNAEQKNYISTNFDTISTLVMYIFQMISLIIWKSYLYFLLINSLVLFIKAIVITLYMNKQYPVFRISEKYYLQSDRMRILKKNIVGGITNKFADSAINQTDSLIISSFVNVDTLGMASNYILLRSYIESFTKPLLENNGSTFGNFVSVESQERKVLFIKTLQLYSLAIYGLSSLLLFFLSTPFIRIWLGDNMIVTNNIVFMIALGLLLSGIGDRPYILFKGAHGIYYDDWYIPLISAFVNLIVSIALVFPFGLMGVYIGTVCTNLISVIWRPFVFYKKATQENVGKYFIRLLKNIGFVAACGLLCNLIFSQFYISNAIIEIVIKGIIVVSLFAVMYIMAYRRTEEFRYIKQLLLGIIGHKK